MFIVATCLSALRHCVAERRRDVGALEELKFVSRSPQNYECNRVLRQTSPRCECGLRNARRGSRIKVGTLFLSLQLRRSDYVRGIDVISIIELSLSRSLSFSLNYNFKSAILRRIKTNMEVFSAIVCYRDRSINILHVARDNYKKRSIYDPLAKR